METETWLTETADEILKLFHACSIADEEYMPEKWPYVLVWFGLFKKQTNENSLQVKN